MRSHHHIPHICIFPSWALYLRVCKVYQIRNDHLDLGILRIYTLPFFVLLSFVISFCTRPQKKTSLVKKPMRIICLHRPQLRKRFSKMNSKRNCVSFIQFKNLCQAFRKNSQYYPMNTPLFDKSMSTPISNLLICRSTLS